MPVPYTWTQQISALDTPRESLEAAPNVVPFFGAVLERFRCRLLAPRHHFRGFRASFGSSRTPPKQQGREWWGSQTFICGRRRRRRRRPGRSCQEAPQEPSESSQEPPKAAVEGRVGFADLYFWSSSSSSSKENLPGALQRRRSLLESVSVAFQLRFGVGFGAFSGWFLA